MFHSTWGGMGNEYFNGRERFNFARQRLLKEKNGHFFFPFWGVFLCFLGGVFVLLALWYFFCFSRVSAKKKLGFFSAVE